MDAPFPCHPIPAVAAQMDADAALTERVKKLGIAIAEGIAPLHDPRPVPSARLMPPALAQRLAKPETAEAMARSTVALDVGVSETNPDGPHPGKYWLDIVMADGRHLSAVLLPELLGKLVRQAATAGVAP